MFDRVNRRRADDGGRVGDHDGRLDAAIRRRRQVLPLQAAIAGGVDTGDIQGLHVRPVDQGVAHALDAAGSLDPDKVGDGIARRLQGRGKHRAVDAGAGGADIRGGEAAVGLSQAHLKRPAGARLVVAQPGDARLVVDAEGEGGERHVCAVEHGAGGAAGIAAQVDQHIVCIARPVWFDQHRVLAPLGVDQETQLARAVGEHGAGHRHAAELLAAPDPAVVGAHPERCRAWRQVVQPGGIDVRHLRLVVGGVDRQAGVDIGGAERLHQLVGRQHRLGGRADGRGQVG